MLESLACDLLNEYFGAYVENLNRENLSLQVWKGEVQLERLALKQTALEDLNLPIDVRTGHIEKLSMRIPWRNLKGEPVVINIKGLYVLANPRVQVEYNEATEKQRQQALKERALAEFEALKLKQLQKVEEQKGDNFNATLVGKIVNNLQLVIEDVHIRYEDHTSTPETPIAVGVTLGSFTARSTSSDWQIKFIQGDSPISYKLLDLQGLALYYETNAKMTRAKDMKLQDFFTMMANGIARSTEDGQPFILQPVNCEAKVVLNNTRPLDLAMPRQAVTISLPAIPIHLQDVQYQSCMQVLEAFSRARRGERYRKFRPPLLSGESRLRARQLWDFAVASVLADIKERNRRYTWEYFMQRRKDRIMYVAAYVKKKTMTALPPEVTQTLQALEARLPFEDIRYFRCLGDVKLRNEAPLREAAAERAREERLAAGNQAQRSSWFTGLWGPDPKPGQAAGAGLPSPEQAGAAKEAAAGPTALALTVEQRQELFAAIGYVGEEVEPDSLLPPSYVSSRLAFALQKGSFALTALQPNRTKVALVEVEFSDLVATLSHRAGSSSMLTEISLGSLALHDKVTRNPQFPAIVRPVSDQPVGLAALLDTPNGHSRKPSNSGVKKEALFSMVHETNPLNSKADAYVAVHSKALFLVYNPLVVKKVVKFFTPPEDLQVAHDLAAAAQRQMETTSLSVWTALYSRSVYDVSIVIEAPNIIIPERADDANCAVAVLDLGQLKVSSVPRASHKRRHKRTHTNPTDEDFVTPAETPSELEGLGGSSAKDIELFLYDRFVLELTDAQLLCSRVSAPWQAAMQKPTSSMHVIDKFSMTLDMAKCITKALQEYPNTKLTASLPSLEVHASDQKIADVASCFVGAFGRSGGSSRGGGEASLSAHQSVLEGEPTADDDQLFAQLLMDREIQPKVRNPSTVLVQATFEMPHILVTLHSSHDVSGVLEAEGVEGLERGRALIGLEVTGVAMSFVQRYYDTRASFTVASVEIPDLQGLGGPQFPCLLTSRDQGNKEVVAGQDLPVPLGLWAKHHTSLAGLDQPVQGTPVTDTRLITFTWHRIDPQHPHFATTHEGYEVLMDVSFNTLTMHVVPDTIAEVRAFAQALSDTFERLTVGPSPAVSRTASLDHPADPPGPDVGGSTDEEPGAGHQPRIRLTAQFKQLGVTLVQNKQPLLSADMGGFQVAIDSSADRLQLKGKVMGVCVLDRTAEGRRYRNVVSNYAKEVLSFDITKHAKSSTDHRAEEMTVHVRTGDLKVFYTERFYQLVTAYFANFRYAYRLYQAAASAAAGAAASLTKSVEWTKLDVVVDSPMIVLPRNANSDQVLIGNLGRLTVSNQLAAHPSMGQTVDVMTVGLSEMALYTGLRENVVDSLASTGPASPGLSVGRRASDFLLGQPMVHDITFDLVVTSLVDVPSSQDIAPRDISGKMSDIEITLSQRGYQQLMGTIDENLMYQLPGDEMASLGLLGDPDSTSVDTMSVASELGSEDVESLAMTVDIRVPHVRLLLRTEAPDQPAPALQRSAGLQQGVALRERDLCDVVAEGFSLAVRRRAHDFVADVALQSLRITDLLQETDKENAVMATDQPDLGSIGGLPGTGEGDGDERQSLVCIRVSRASGLSPMFQQQNGLGRVVDIRLHDVGLLVNMETWVLLIDFFLSSEDTALRTTLSKSAAGHGRAAEQPAKKAARDAEVWNISARTLILTMNKGRRQLARFDARSIEFSAHLGGIHDDGGVRFDGKLGWLRVLDLTPRGALYSTVFITSGGEMLSFCYTKLGNAAPVRKQLQGLDHPAKVGDSLLRLKIGEAYVVYCRRFIDQLFEYIFQFQHLQDLLSYLRTGQEQQPDLRFYYSINLLNPGIVVPAKSTSELALIAYLGNITVNNSYVNRPPQQEAGQGDAWAYWLDCISVDMADMALWSARLCPTMQHGHMTVFNDAAAGAPGNRRRTTDTGKGWGDLRVASVQPIIRECSSSLTVERRLALSGSPEGLLGPQYRVQWAVADARVVLDDLSHAIVRALLEAGNLAEAPMPDDPVQLAAPAAPPATASGQVADEEVLVFELRMSGITLEVTEYAHDKTATTWGVGPALDSVGLARFRLFESTVCFSSTLGGRKTTDFQCARLTAVDLRSEARGSAHPNVLTDDVESYLSHDHTLLALDDEPSLRVTYLAQPTGQASLGVHLNKSRLLWVWDFFMELKTYLLEPLNIYTAHSSGPTLALRRDPLSPPSGAQSASTVDSGPLRQLTTGNRFECAISLKKPELVFVYDLGSASSCSVAVQCDAHLSLDMAPHARSGAMWWRLSVGNVFCYSYWIGHKDTMVTLLDRCKFELTWREQLRLEDARPGASADVAVLLGDAPVGGAGGGAVVERDFRLEFQDDPVKLRLSPQEVDLLQRIADVHFMPRPPPQVPRSGGGLAAMGVSDKMLFLNAEGYEKAWCKAALDRNNEDLEHAVMWLSYSYDPDAPPPGPDVALSIGPVSAVRAMLSEDFTLNQAQAGQGYHSDPQPAEHEEAPGDAGPQVTYREMFTLCTQQPLTVQLYMAKNGLVIPLVEFTNENTLLDVRNWSSSTNLLYQATVRLDFYDSHIAAWVPLVEHFTVEVKHVDQKERGRIIRMRNFGTDQGPLMVTVSSHMLAAVDMACQSLSTIDSAYWSKPQDRLDYQPFSLENRTGVPLHFWPVGMEGRRFDVGAGASQQFDLGSAKDLLGPGQQGGRQQTAIEIKLLGYRPLKAIEVSRTGHFGLLACSEQPGSQRDHVLVTLAIHNNRKTIEVRSMVQLANRMPVALALCLEHPTTKDWTEPLVVRAGEVYPLPLQYVRSNFKVRPDVAGTRYNFCNALVQDAADIKFLKCFRQGEAAGPGAYNMILHTETRKQQVTQFVSYNLQPPLRLENLCPCDMIVMLGAEESLHVGSGQVRDVVGVDFSREVTARLKLIDEPYNASPVFRLHKPGANAQRDVQGAVELEEVVSSNARSSMAYGAGRALTLTLTNTQRVAQGPRHVAIWAPFWIINQTGLPLSFRQHFKQVSSRLVPGTGNRPFMWAFGGASGASMDDADQLCIASQNTDWSSPFRIDLVGQGRRLDLRVNGGMRAAFSSSKAYEIACKTTRALGRFERVRVTVLLPAIMLVSKCNVPVVYYQATSADRMAIQPGQKVPFHWPNVKEPRVLCLEVDHGGERYVSQGFGVEMGVSNFSVKLRMVRGRRIMYIPVVVKQIKSCHVLILGQPVGRLPTTYVIKNLTSHAITVRQDAPGVEAEELGPHFQVAYGWDCLLADPKRLVVTFPGIASATGHSRQEVYELDTLAAYVPVEYRRYFYIQTPSGLVLQPTQTPDGKTFIRLKGKSSVQRDLQLWYMDRQTIRLKATDDLLLPLHGRVEEYTQLVLGDSQQLLAECWVLRPGGQVVSAQAWHMAWQVETDQPGSVVRIMPASDDPRQRFVLSYVTPGTGKITAKVLAEGPVRVLRLAEVEPQLTDETIDFRGVNLALSQDMPERLLLKVKVGLSSGLCISLIDERPVEVGHIVLRDIELGYMDTDLHRSLKVRIASLQVDNQLFSDPKRHRPGIHSVVVAPLPEERRRLGKKRGSGSGSSLSLTSQKDPELESAYFEFFGKVSKESTTDVHIVRDISMAVQNFNVFLDEEFFYRMVSLFTVLLAQKDDGRALVSVDPLQEIEKQFENTGRARLYIERLEVAPVDFYISIMRSGGLPGDLQGLGELQALPLVNINYLQLRLSRVRLQHAFDDPLAIFHRVRRQYKTQLLAQWYKGIAHGVSVAARAVTSTLADWTLDEDYQRDRVRRKEEARADSPGAQFASGVKGLFGGVASGLTGIVEKPIRGFAEEGMEGLLKGVGKGLVGVVMKPVGGVSDFMVETGSAVHSGTTAPRIVAQVVRLARWIPPDRVLVPYDDYAAAGQRMLWSLLALHSRDPPSPREEVYQMHVWLNPGSTPTELWPVDPPRNPGHCLLVSTRHIIEFFVQTDGDKRYYEIQSMHPISRVVSACATAPPPGGLRITLAPPSSPALSRQSSRLGHSRSASGTVAPGRELVRSGGLVPAAVGWRSGSATSLRQLDEPSDVQYTLPTASQAAAVARTIELTMRIASQAEDCVAI